MIIKLKITYACSKTINSLQSVYGITYNQLLIIAKSIFWIFIEKHWYI